MLILFDFEIQLYLSISLLERNFVNTERLREKIREKKSLNSLKKSTILSLSFFIFFLFHAASSSGFFYFFFDA